jgi:predicted nucleotidyltransferase
MNPRDPNVQQLQLVANALGHLREKLVFVGGCATGVLITDNARPPVRATQDVDLIAEIVTKAKYYELAADLRKLGFREDTENVICRWRLGDLKVDVMPSSESVLSFTNKWYSSAIEECALAELPDGTKIRLITAPYFIATKLEAFYDRGGGDYMSHDMEDILSVIDGRPEIVHEISQQRGPVAAYLKAEIDDLISDESFLQSLPAHFLPNSIEQQRVPMLLGRLREIAGL